MLGFFLTENTSNPRYLKPGRIPFPLYEFSRDASGLAVRHGLYSVRPLPNVGTAPNPLYPPQVSAGLGQLLILIDTFVSWLNN